MPLTAEARCAFGRCQAGAVILPGTPTVGVVWTGDFTLRDGTKSRTYRASFHPGCWAADQRERETTR